MPDAAKAQSQGAIVGQREERRINQIYAHVAAN
jgi:hypothetical protein